MALLENSLQDKNEVHWAPLVGHPETSRTISACPEQKTDAAERLTQIWGGTQLEYWLGEGLSSLRQMPTG
jgi:hypothetical protein